MADELKPGEESATPSPAGPGGGGSKLLLILVLANLGATGFVATRGLHPPAAQAAESTENKPGPTVSLETFVVNLNEPGNSRYLKCTIELEVTGVKAVKEVTDNKRLVRDEILRYLSGLTVADTLGEQGKARIQTDVVSRVDRLLGGGRIRRLFFIDFVVQ